MRLRLRGRSHFGAAKAVECDEFLDIETVPCFNMK